MTYSYDRTAATQFLFRYTPKGWEKVNRVPPGEEEVR